MGDKRGEHYLDIPIGTIVRHSKTGLEYVFLGWGRNTVGREAVFGIVMTERRIGYHCVGTYFAAMLDTLLAVFPDLGQYQVEEKS